MAERQEYHILSLAAAWVVAKEFFFQTLEKRVSLIMLPE
jgi:hypothetical protein